MTLPEAPADRLATGVAPTDPGNFRFLSLGPRVSYIMLVLGPKVLWAIWSHKLLSCGDLGAQKENINIKISQSGSKAQHEGDTQNHVL